MKTLPAQHLRYSDYERVLAAVDALLWELVYEPVVALVRPTLPRPVAAALAPRDLLRATPQELRNAADAEGQAALHRALKDGSVQLVADPKTGKALFFVAKPDRRISDGLRSFGAALDKRTGAWSCAPAKVPAWVRAESAAYSEKAREAHDRVVKLLQDIDAKVDEAVENYKMAKAADHAVSEVAKGWKESAGTLQTSWSLGDQGRAVLAAEFEKSAKIEIKGWAREAVGRLREQVEQNAMQGYRAEELAERIRSEYGVSKARADLIASQETRNFMANFRAARAKDAGLSRYKWRVVGDSKTRPDHKKLDGRVFFYDQPPIVDSRTGRRANPGQDFRCRCVDLPVVS